MIEAPATFHYVRPVHYKIRCGWKEA